MHCVYMYMEVLKQYVICHGKMISSALTLHSKAVIMAIISEDFSVCVNCTCIPSWFEGLKTMLTPWHSLQSMFSTFYCSTVCFPLLEAERAILNRMGDKNVSPFMITCLLS